MIQKLCLLLIFGFLMSFTSFSQNCEINDLIVEAHECDDGTFLVDIDFNNPLPGPSNMFKVLGNGNNYGTFSYDDLFITLGPLEGDCETPFEFVIIDIDDPDCQKDYELGIICCESEECVITDLIVEAYECVNEQFFVDIDFNVSNPISDSFTVVGNGTNYGSFAYTDLFISLGPLSADCETPYEFIVFDSESEACNKAYELGVICCESEECDISELSVETIECDDEGNYWIELNFAYDWVTMDSFDVYTKENVFLGSYAYTDLPVEILFTASGNDEDWIIVCDQGADACCEDLWFEALDCPCGPECSITNIEYEVLPCNEEGKFNIELDFDPQNTSGSFKLKSDGQSYGVYNYSSLPVIIEGLMGDCETFYDFAIIDSDDPNCNNYFEVGKVCCDEEPCEITELSVQPIECTGEGLYKVIINFQHQNTGGLGFDLFANGDYFGFYNYSDLPLTINNFPASGNDFDWIKVCDNDSECCKTKEFESLECFEECHIGDVSVSPSECSKDGTFFVVIDFNYQNTGGPNFEIVGNGNNYGTFAYADLPVTIEGLIGDCETEYEFIIKDLELPECSNFGFIEPVCCDEECELNEMTATFIECTGDGLYAIQVDFSHSGTGGLGFDLYANGNFFGFYGYNELPLTITDFPASGNAVDWIQVCDNDSECCTGIEYESPECTEPCSISGLSAVISPCDGGFFNVTLNFDVQNPPSTQFGVAGNGNNYGNFNYTDLPISIGPLEGDGLTEYEFVIYDSESEECNIVIEIGTIDCPSVGTKDELENKISIYMVSASELVIDQGENISIPFHTIKLFAVDGKTIEVHKLDESALNQKISVQNLIPGVYFYSIISEEQQSSGKLIIMD